MSPLGNPQNHARALLSTPMRKVLDGMARSTQAPMYTTQPQQARAAYAAGAGVLEQPKQSLARVDDFCITTRDQFALPVRLYAPSHAVWPVLIYFHGGGFTVGSVDTHDGLCRRLSHLAQCAVLSVDYRLAPEFKFPTAHNDAWDAVQWVAQHGHTQGLDNTRMAVGGDSAGGTLATACAIAARDAHLPLALQLLFYPGCAGHQNTASHQRFAQGFVLEEPLITYFFNHYVRTPQDRDDWRFAPLDGKAADGQLVDLSGVAPAWMGLAECDPLVDEGVQYADRLRMAGCAVALEIYRGVVHEFIKMDRVIPEASQAHADAAQALREVFAP